MDEQLRYTTFDPAIPQLLTRIRSVAGKSTGEQLEADLDALIQDEFESIRAVRQRIADDLRLHDYVLDEVSRAVAHRLLKGKPKRNYVLITKCDSCADSGKKRRSDSAKQIQIMPVDEYMFEADFQEGLSRDVLVEAGYKPDCGTCGSPLVVTNASNVILPAKAGAIFAITARVKSPGRYCQKLVDLAFYDPKDPRMKKRNIIDRYAFAVIANYPNGRNESEFRRVFRRQLGVSVTGKRPFEDEVCYAVFKILTREFKVDSGTVEDLLRTPKEREFNGRTEFYKILQFHMQFKGRKLEGQIKSHDTFRREQDRKSAINHANYVEVEEKLRQNLWDKIPKARTVYDVLMKVFAEKKLLQV